MQWLRLYDDVLDDPKVQRLPPALFKHWINLLCLANRGSPRGRLPESIDDIAFALRISFAEADDAIHDLKARGLIHTDENDRVVPHNWDGRQFKSDNVSERVTRFRERNVTRNVTETPSETPPDTEQSQIQSRTEQSVGASAPAKPKRATQVPENWQPTQELYVWAANELDMSAGDVNRETFKFRDHFIANGKPMKDWSAAWKNWMRRSREFAAPVRAGPSNGTPTRATVEDFMRLAGVDPGGQQ